MWLRNWVITSQLLKRFTRVWLLLLIQLMLISKKSGINLTIFFFSSAAIIKMIVRVFWFAKTECTIWRCWWSPCFILQFYRIFCNFAADSIYRFCNLGFYVILRALFRHAINIAGLQFIRTFVFVLLISVVGRSRVSKIVRSHFS